MKKITMICLMIVLSLSGIAAGESITFSVSCTIPEIPGVNAPPFEEKTTMRDVEQATQQDVALQEENKTEQLQTIQEESKKEVQLAEGKASSIAVQTIYSR
jgi:hypothetical protein